jgi:hypothetical protein
LTFISIVYLRKEAPLIHRRLVLILLGILFLPSVGLAQSTLKERSRDFGISVGYIFEGSAYFAEDDEYSAHTGGPMLRLFYDKFVAEQFAVGLYSHTVPTDFPRYTTETGALLAELGFAFKARFFPGEKLAVKPGLNVGYRYYFADDDYVAGDALGLNVSLELQYDMGASYLPYIETGFLSQPWGGNEYTDITYSPIMYVQVGLAL